MENPTKQILKVNLGIFAAYTLLSYLMGYKDQSGVLFHAFFISTHAIITFLVGVIRLIMYRKDSEGGAYILSAIMVLVIGFGTCVGILQVMTHGRGLSL